MNRLSWDTTGPRRPNGKRRPASPRPTPGLLEESAGLIHGVWDRPQRISGLY